MLVLEGVGVDICIR